MEKYTKWILLLLTITYPYFAAYLYHEAVIEFNLCTICFYDFLNITFLIIIWIILASLTGHLFTVIKD